jgi:hypothetical protein
MNIKFDVCNISELLLGASAHILAMAGPTESDDGEAGT